MTADRCRPLKLEDGPYGSSTDTQPTEVNPHSDGVDVAAVFLQSASSADSTCYFDRDPADGAARVTDTPEGTRRIADLISRTQSASAYHGGLQDIIHFLDQGPGDGFASGSVYVQLNNGPLCTGWVWYQSSAQTLRILDVTYSFPAGSILPSAKVWRLYATNGTTVVRTLVDTFNWSGPLLTGMARNWA